MLGPSLFVRQWPAGAMGFSLSTVKMVRTSTISRGGPFALMGNHMSFLYVTPSPAPTGGSELLRFFWRDAFKQIIRRNGDGFACEGGICSRFSPALS